MSSNEHHQFPVRGFYINGEVLSKCFCSAPPIGTERPEGSSPTVKEGLRYRYPRPPSRPGNCPAPRLMA